MEKIVLNYPVDVAGQKYSELHMRRPKVRDHLVADRSSGGNAEKEVKLLANLCEVAPAVIEELDAADYQTLQGVYGGFLSSRRRT